MRWPDHVGDRSLARRTSLLQRHLVRVALRSARPRGFASLRAPLLGFIKERPSAVSACCVHSQSDRGPILGAELPHPTRVPPLPFLTTSVVYSTTDRVSLLRLTSSHGVRRVLVALRLRPRPPRRRRTLRSFSLPGSGSDVTTGPFPLAVAASGRRLMQAWGPLSDLPRPQGFVPPESPLRCRRVSARAPPDAPLGFCTDFSDLAASDVAFDCDLGKSTPPESVIDPASGWRSSVTAGCPTVDTARRSVTVLPFHPAK